MMLKDRKFETLEEGMDCKFQIVYVSTRFLYVCIDI